ncbi:hypothetical protein MPSEU_001078500 [Mayamaea pseudoterrestris]|nr:hypothetical protein MPSEU_001078500 [Mayamaea pseudoterrestris]
MKRNHEEMEDAVEELEEDVESGAGTDAASLAQAAVASPNNDENAHETAPPPLLDWQSAPENSPVIPTEFWAKYTLPFIIDKIDCLRQGRDLCFPYKPKMTNVLSMDFATLVFMTIKPEFLDQLLVAFRERPASRQVTSMTLDLTDYFFAEQRLTQLPAVHAAQETTKHIGTVFGETLKSVTFRLKVPHAPNAAMLCANLVRYCNQIKEVTMNFKYLPGNWRPHLATVQAATDALRGHPSIEKYIITCVDSSELVATLFEPLPSMPRLKYISMVRSHPDDISIRFPIAFTLEYEAASLRNALLVKTLTNVSLQCLTFASSEATDIFCDGMAKSSFTTFRAMSLGFPKDKGVAVAQAICSSKIEDLSFSCHAGGYPSVDFFVTLGRGISPSLKVLRLTVCGSEPEAPQSDPLDVLILAFMQHAPRWNVRKLTVEINSDSWTEQVEESFARYIATSDCLRKLCVVPSEGFLTAVRTGKGALEDIKVGIFTFDSMGTIRKHVRWNVNRLERVHGPAFEAMLHASNGASRALTLDKLLVN